MRDTLVGIPYQAPVAYGEARLYKIRHEAVAEIGRCRRVGRQHHGLGPHPSGITGLLKKFTTGGINAAPLWRWFMKEKHGL